MKTKKLVALVLVAVLAITSVVGTTLAYFIDNDDSVTNTFTVGNVEITLTEPAWTTGELEGKEVYPGEALAKDPTVTNTGKNPCFVRVKVENLKQFGNKGDITLRHGQFAEGYDSANWTLHTDGYYYYNEVLATSATAGDEYNEGLEAVTTPLFNQIVMPTGLVGDETTLPITVTAQAVQAQGAKASYGAVKAMTVEEIAAWFTTCGLPAA